MESKPIKIEPVSFRSGPPSPREKPFNILKWLAGVFLGMVLILLGVSAWFVFTARQVVITIAPVPETLAFSGSMPAPRIGDHYLMRPGEYTLTAVKECFYPLEHTFRVSAEKRQKLHLKMEKLPGRLMIQAHQSGVIQSKIVSAQVYIDGHEVGKTPLESIEIKPGPAKLEIRASNYQDLNTEIQVHGCGKLQEFNMALLPGWSDVTVSSVPQGAILKIDGKSFGNTPSRIQLAAGTYLMEISADLYKTWTHRLIVKPNEPLEIKDIRLQPADGKLELNTTPVEANVMIDGTFIGQTPLVIDLSPDKNHVIRISKAGYEKTTRNVNVSSATSTRLHANLKPRKGIINLWLKPTGTELLLNGKSRGTTPKQLQLIAVEHTLEFRKKGYRSYRTHITPRPGFPQELKISLIKESASQKGTSTMITTHTGYRLKLIRPKTYTMGSSRREQGRRSNETLRKVKLTRPFYMGIQEVTNKEFREFMAQHHSGTFKSKHLNRDDQPVVRITWEQAALFCNWVSAKESLSPAYIKKGEKLIAVEPLNTGYRLPTEAEWEYCARFSHTQTSLKYPWGQQFPPKQLSGNYSDQSAKDLLPNVLKGYNDQYATTAPPAKFKPNGLGLYDMGGNVAEWCHDYYSIYSYAPEKMYVDPAGPVNGKHHVIRGSGWKHGSIGTLRLAYRSYGDDKREDVGFRVCRYLK
ncbi:MAG: PEGA domain-containing protein [Desulfobacterales bacterium]|jgi:formylglycine-generating enzyme required for sulfatase activity